MPSTIENEETLLANPSVSDLVGQCFNRALDYRSSDIHLQPSSEGLLIKIRVDGTMRDLVVLPPALEPRVINFVKTMASMDVNERRLPTDGRFTYRYNGRSFDMRVNSASVCEKVIEPNGLCRQRMTIRVLDGRSIEVPLGGLGFLTVCEEMIKKALYRRQGLILCSGPTGSGKTTLLYVMTKGIADSTVNILGVGDPPEYEIAGVSQGAVSEACGFAEYVRCFLRQDPDVILVGEIRDNETADVVTGAAIMGRLVLSSIHTRSAVLAPFRLGRLGVDKSLVAEALNLVVNQRLVKRLCPDCRERVLVPTPSWLELSEIQRGACAVGARYGEMDTVIETYRPGGVQRDGSLCKTCGGQGYIGRIGVFEVLDAMAMAKTLRQDLDPGNLYDRAIENDSIWPLAADAMAKVFRGDITIEDAKTICLC